MKQKFIMISSLLTLILAFGGCTPEFEFEMPDKDAWKDIEKVEYDITFASLLEEMISMEEVTKYPAVEYKTKQASSYDRASVNPTDATWFSNNDGFGYIRQETNEGRREYVMMESNGPGVITRMWLTSLTDDQAVVRFYFNGNTSPDWTIDNFYLKNFDKALEEGGVRPLGQGFVNPISPDWKRGSNLYLPIPFSSGCKITYEERSTQLNPNRYFQINYREYAPTVNVETFSLKVFNAQKARIAEINSGIVNPKIKVSGKMVKANGELQNGKHIKIELPAGQNAVTELRISVDDYGPYYESVMDGLIFIAEFDGEVTASLPLADLVLAGPGAPRVSNYFVDCDGRGEIVIRFPMPYQNSGSLQIKNIGIRSATVNMQARAGAFARDSRTLYFHAAAKYLPNSLLPHCLDYASCYEWNYATISGGRGVLRSDMYSMDNSTADWPGEGDEKIYVDDEVFPSHFGTGTEDYFGFCFDRPYQHPFVGESRLDNGNFKGVDTYQRVRCLDCIPFSSKLKFDFEVGGWLVGTVGLRNSVIWYGDLNTHATGVNEY